MDLFFYYDKFYAIMKLLNVKWNKWRFFLKKSAFIFAFDFFNYTKNVKKFIIKTYFLTYVLSYLNIKNKIFLNATFKTLLNFILFFFKNNYIFNNQILYYFFLKKNNIKFDYSFYYFFNNKKISMYYNQIFFYNYTYNSVYNYIYKLKNLYSFLTYSLHIDLNYADVDLFKVYIRNLILSRKNTFLRNIFFILSASAKVKTNKNKKQKKVDLTLKGILKRRKFYLKKKTNNFYIQYHPKYFHVLNKNILNYHKKSLFFSDLYFPLISSYLNFFFFKGDYYRLSTLLFQFKNYFIFNDDYINLYKLSSNVKFKDSYYNLFYFINKINYNYNCLNLFPYDLNNWFLNHKILSVKLYSFLYSFTLKNFFIFFSFLKKFNKDYRNKFYFKQRFSFIFRLPRKFRLRNLRKYRRYKINNKYLFFKTIKLLKWQKIPYKFNLKFICPKFLKNYFFFLQYLYKKFKFFNLNIKNLKKKFKYIMPDSFYIKFLKNDFKKKKTLSLSVFFKNKLYKKNKFLKISFLKKISVSDMTYFSNKKNKFLSWIKINFFTLIKKGKFLLLNKIKIPFFLKNTFDFYNYFLKSQNSFLFFFKNYLSNLKLSSLLISKNSIFNKNKLCIDSKNKSIHNLFLLKFNKIQRKFIFFFILQEKNKFSLNFKKKKKEKIKIQRKFIFSFFFFFLFYVFIKKFYFIRSYFFIENLYFWLYDKSVILFRKLKNSNIFFIALLNNILFNKNYLFFSRFFVLDSLFFHFFNSSFLDLKKWKNKKIFFNFFKKKKITRYSKKRKRFWNKFILPPKYCKIMRITPYNYI